MQEVGLGAGRLRGLKVEGVVKLPRPSAGEGFYSGQFEKPVPLNCTFIALFREERLELEVEEFLLSGVWVVLMDSCVKQKLGGAGLQPRETDRRIFEYLQVGDGDGLECSGLSWYSVWSVGPQ